MTHERGSTMVEVMGVIAVLGVLVISVWKLIDSAMYKYRISESVIGLQSLAKNISRFYATVGNYDELTQSGIIQKLSENRVIPKKMQAGSDAIRYLFGGEVTIGVAPSKPTESSSDGTNFSITYKEVERKICVELVTLNWQKTDNANLVWIKIGNDSYEWPKYGESSEDLTTSVRFLPVSITEALDSCSTNDGSLVDIVWAFR